MVKKIGAWWRAHRPTRRRLIQLYAALLCNAHAKGLIEGEIYTGPIKKLCVPGLNCYSCPAAVGACPLGALQNALASSGVRAPWYALGILLLLGLMLGRTICGWLCPFGLIQELIYRLPTPKLPKSRVTRALSRLKYVVLAVFVLALPLLSAARRVPVPAFCKLICPAGTLEGAALLLAHPRNASLRSMLGALFANKLLLLALILVSCVLAYRAFCRFLCPLGAIYGLFSRLSLLGVRVDAARCTGCGQCVARCPMDVRRVGDSECIHCGQCASACPTKAIYGQLGALRVAPGDRTCDASGGKRRLRVLAAQVCALALLFGVVFAANQPGKAPQAPLPDEMPVGAEVGMRCPDFSVKLCGGGSSFSPRDALGRPVVLNFWATWCGPCVVELPYFQRIHETYGEQIAVVAIHSPLVTDDVEAYLSAQAYAFPFAIDEDGGATTALGGSNMLPMTVILDGEGRIVHRQVGSTTFEALEEVLESLL